MGAYPTCEPCGFNPSGLLTASCLSSLPPVHLLCIFCVSFGCFFSAAGFCSIPRENKEGRLDNLCWTYNLPVGCVPSVWEIQECAQQLGVERHFFSDPLSPCCLLPPAPMSPHHFLSLLHRVGSGTGVVVGLPPRLLLISGDGSVMCSCEAVDVPQWPTHTYHSVVYKRLTRSRFCRLSGLANAVVRALEAACLALNHHLLTVCPWAATSLSISCLNSKMGIISERMMKISEITVKCPGWCLTHTYIFICVYMCLYVVV